MSAAEYLTPEEAAALLKIPVRTIRLECERGKLPACKFGRRWRILRARLPELFGGSHGSVRVVVVWRNNRQDWIFEGSKADAKAFEAAEKLKARVQAPRAACGMPTLMELCQAGGLYEEHAKLRLAETTRTARKYVLRDLLREMGNLRLDAITDRVVTRAARVWLDGDRERGIPAQKATTVNCKLRALRAILNFARNKCGLLLPPPAFDDLAEPQERRQVRAWTQEQIATLLDTCARLDAELLPHLVFLANTGCRKTETLHVEWDDVDLERRTVTLWRTKTGRSREVPINDTLAAWLERQPHANRYVFASERGDRFKYWPQRRFDLVRKAAGLVGGPHRFRHSYATEHFRQGGHPGELAVWFGASETVIRKTYRHLLPGHLDAVRNRVSFAAGIGPAEAAALRKWGQK